MRKVNEAKSEINMWLSDNGHAAEEGERGGLYSVT